MKVRELFEDATKEITYPYTCESSDVINGHFKPGLDCVYTKYFACERLGLTTLEGGPKTVSHSFIVTNNLLTNLIDGPTSVGRGSESDYNISQNSKLTSLEGIPEILNCSLIMDGLNGNVKMSRNHATDGNEITSFSGCGKKFLKRVNGWIILPFGLKSNILGLLLVKDLDSVVGYGRNSLKEAMEIINKHLKADRNLRKCKLELYRSLLNYES